MLNSLFAIALGAVVIVVVLFVGQHVLAIETRPPNSHRSVPVDCRKVPQRHLRRGAGAAIRVPPRIRRLAGGVTIDRTVNCADVMSMKAIRLLAAPLLLAVALLVAGAQFGPAGAATTPSTSTPENVVPPAAAHLPRSVFYEYSKLDDKMLGNNSVGDCMVAAAATDESTQRQSVGLSARLPTTTNVLTEYATLAGGVGADVGVYPDTLFQQWTTAGLFGQRAAAVSELAGPTSIPAVKTTIDQLGGAIAILDPPAVINVPSPTVWTYSANDGPGFPPFTHAITLIGYTPSYLVAATWGQVVFVTWSYFEHYVTDVYAVIPQAFVAVGHGPTGVPIRRLAAEFDPTPPTVSGSLTLNTTDGTPMSATYVSNESVTWTVTNDLAQGLQLVVVNSTTAEITGTPDESFGYDAGVGVTATAANGSSTQIDVQVSVVQP